VRRLSQSRPSPALVVAIVALVAAVAGTAIAQEATTSAKPVTKKKVKKIARKQINKLAPGLSVANADNATNATNAENAQTAENANQLGGVPAAAHLRNVEIVTAQSASNSNNKSVTATCPAGKRLVGGGARERVGFLANSATVAITASGPSHPPLGAPSNTAWTASGEEYAADPDNWRIVAYAICADG